MWQAGSWSPTEEWPMRVCRGWKERSEVVDPLIVPHDQLVPSTVEAPECQSKLTVECLSAVYHTRPLEVTHAFCRHQKASKAGAAWKPQAIMIVRTSKRIHYSKNTNQVGEITRQIVSS
jgi:hypothetical protein